MTRPPDCDSATPHPSGPTPAASSSASPAAARRFIALHWQLTATYHTTWAAAEATLADLPASQRAGIVDSQTGKTLASQAAYPAVEAAARREVLGIMRRAGPLGDLAGERRRRGRSAEPEALDQSR